MASCATTASVIQVFSRTHYHIWAVKMKTYLKSQGLWKAVETDESTPAHAKNPTVAQLRTYDTKSLKKDKALTCLHSCIVDQIFTSIMDLETPKAKVVEKMMISVPPKFEAKISAIEESCDLDTLMVSELTSKLQAQEQRVSIRSGVKVKDILDMENDSYYLKLDVANASTFSVTEDDSMKWDKRNGHFNYRTLKHMNTTKLVRDMSPISEVDIPEFDIEDVINTDVLRTRPLVDVYESCNSVIEPKTNMDTSKHFEWINAMKVKLEEKIYVKQPQAFEVVGQDEKVYRHYNSLYGPKRSSTENLVQHGRSKHINFKYHVIREAKKNEEVKLKYCTSETQLGDMLTKSITEKKLNYFKAHLMESNNNLKEEC
ncbi:retrovirus-related pol polyprotein from transposon TNT 1-94 [Tanacetum coccineum]